VHACAAGRGDYQERPPFGARQPDCPGDLLADDRPHAAADETEVHDGEYDRAAAAAAFGKPVVWGEAGIDGPGSTDVEDPALAQDREGVWLHKLLWARLGPGGVYPLYWYTDNIFRHQLHRHFGALNRFLADIPLGNGHYRDLAAEVSSEDLLVLGQKDTQAGRAHVWINNRGHTWRAVVEGREARPVDGTLAIGMEKPDLAYRLTWYDTLTAQPTGEETLFAGPSGRIVLEVRGLKTDVAAKIERK